MHSLVLEDVVGAAFVINARTTSFDLLQTGFFPGFMWTLEVLSAQSAYAEYAPLSLLSSFLIPTSPPDLRGRSSDC